MSSSKASILGEPLGASETRKNSEFFLASHRQGGQKKTQ
jgi:hypothetical protein